MEDVSLSQQGYAAEQSYPCHGGPGSMERRILALAALITFTPLIQLRSQDHTKVPPYYE